MSHIAREASDAYLNLISRNRKLLWIVLKALINPTVQHRPLPVLLFSNLMKEFLAVPLPPSTCYQLTRQSGWTAAGSFNYLILLLIPATSLAFGPWRRLEAGVRPLRALAMLCVKGKTGKLTRICTHWSDKRTHAWINNYTLAVDQYILDTVCVKL